MKRRLLLTALPLLLAGCASSSASSAAPGAHARTIYLVRHAEKQIIEGEKDPELTAAGFARAAALPAALEGIPLAAIYSSDYRRTQQTVAPIATERGIEVISYDPADAAAFARILQSDPALHILVSGHSNTLPALIEALGATPPTIADGQYGDLFVLTFAGSQTTLRVDHYGE